MAESVLHIKSVVKPPAFETTLELSFEFAISNRNLLRSIDALADGGAGYLAAKQLPTSQWQYRYDALTPAELAAHTQAKLKALEALAPEAAFDLLQWMDKADKSLKLPPIWSHDEPALREAMAAYLIAATTERLELGQKLGGRSQPRTHALKRAPLELMTTGYWVCSHCGTEQAVPHALGTKAKLPADIRCPRCTHRRDFTACDCPPCRELQAEFRAEVLPVIEQTLTHLRECLQQFCANPLAHCPDTAGQKPYPGDVEAERDYRLYRDRMSHSLREVMSLRPQSAEDFEHCLDRCLEKWTEYRKYAYGGRRSPVPRRDDILAEAGKLKVLYVCDEAAQPTEEHVAKQTHLTALRGLCEAVLANPEHAVTYLRSPPQQVVEDRSAISAAYRRHLRPMHHLFLRVIRRTWLNPFYVTSGQATTPTARAPATSALPLYRTEAERETHDRLLQENPGHLVVPHRLLRQIVSKEVLDEHFNSTERNYLFNCELSFAVYDSKGRFCFAEEARRGGHHDKAEWQQKDGLKRRAMELAGLELRESF